MSPSQQDQGVGQKIANQAEGKGCSLTPPNPEAEAREAIDKLLEKVLWSVLNSNSMNHSVSSDDELIVADELWNNFLGAI